MSINKTRGILYKLSKFLCDISVVSSRKSGKVTKRIARGITGKARGKLFRRLFKYLEYIKE